MDKSIGMGLLGIAPKEICRQGVEKLMTNSDVPDLLEFYKKHIDFCFDNDFPNTETLKKYGEGQLKEHGIFINESLYLKNVPFIVARGNTDLNVTISGYNLSQIYAKDKAVLNIEATGEAYIMIDAFDEAIAHTKAKDGARIIVNLYGSAKMTGNGTERKKNKDKY